jgi:hypothetical protein
LLADAFGQRCGIYLAFNRDIAVAAARSERSYNRISNDRSFAMLAFGSDAQTCASRGAIEERQGREFSRARDSHRRLFA